jgi:acyl carrier protein
VVHVKERTIMTPKERIIEIIADQLQVNEEQVTPEANLQEDLGADSIDLIELVMTFEETFDIEIHDEDVENVQTVKDLTDYLEKRLSV